MNRYCVHCKKTTMHRFEGTQPENGLRFWTCIACMHTHTERPPKAVQAYAGMRRMVAIDRMKTRISEKGVNT